MGLFLSKEKGYDPDALSIHQWTGVATSFGLFILMAFQRPLQNIAWVKYTAAAGISALVIFAGHFGGNITHGENFVLAPVTPVHQRIRAAFEDAYVFADLVQPVLENKCLSCHNSNKAKGELIMETKELLLKGGKDGKLWDTSKADLGLMMQRIHLPEEEKEHMPPSGKPQLTNEEIEILYAWIRSGASFEQRVAELPPTDTLRIIASKILKQTTDEQYTFEAADDKDIRGLSNDNRVITPLFLHSPALAVNFYNRDFYNSDQLKQIKPLSRQIVEINLDNMPVKDEDLKTLGDFTSLRRLNLSNSAITGSTLGELKKLVNLKSLSLSGTAVNTSQLRELVTLSKLRSVYVWNTKIAAADIQQLSAQNKNISYQAGFKGDTVVLKLTPPVVENEEEIITGTLAVNLRHYIHGTTIRYTLYGSDPDSIHSRVYDGHLAIDSAFTIKAKAFKPGWISSDVYSRRFFKNSLLPDSVILFTHPDPKYTADGGKTIADLEKGDINAFLYPKWLGFREYPMEAMLVYNKPVEATSIMISAMKNIGGFVMPPASVEVWGGMNEKDLRLIGRTIPAQTTLSETKRKDFVNSENLFFKYSFKLTQLKYIKLLLKPVAKLPQWHQGKGQKGWVFVDEVFVN
jgi:hypothetical protein